MELLIIREVTVTTKHGPAEPGIPGISEQKVFQVGGNSKKMRKGRK